MQHFRSLRVRLNQRKRLAFSPTSIQLGDKVDGRGVLTVYLVPLSYMFDLEYLVDSFSKACPQIRLYLDDAQLPLNASTSPDTLPSFDTLGLSPPEDERWTVGYPEQWRSQFDSWLTESVPSFSTSDPTIIGIKSSLYNFPIHYDRPPFVSTFGKLLRFRGGLRRIAGEVLFSMSRKFGLDLDVSKPGIQQGRFLGVQ